MNQNIAGKRTRAALAFIARGWPIFPLTPGAKIPLRNCPVCSSRSPEYEPHRGIDDCPHQPGTCHGFHAATLEEERVRGWLDRWPDMNIGIATGPARLVVVDLDANKAGAEPPEPYNVPGVVDGSDVFALALERYGVPFPGDTLIVATPSRGLHLYWTLPPGVTVNKSEGDFGWLIDVRAAGSYIVGPTSTTPDGEYRRLGDVVEPLPVPDWVLHHLEGTGHMPKPRPQRAARKFTQQHSTAHRGGKSLDDLAAELAAAQPGQRHRVLCTVTTAAAYLVAAGRCTEADMRAELHAAGRVAERTENEIHDAIDSAFDYVASRGAA